MDGAQQRGRPLEMHQQPRLVSKESACVQQAWLSRPSLAQRLPANGGALSSVRLKHDAADAKVAMHPPFFVEHESSGLADRLAGPMHTTLHPGSDVAESQL